MKKLLCLAAALLALAGCNRSGMIDATVGSVPANAPAKSPAPARIAHGKSVELAAYAAPGRTTIFDFTSEYCGPCREIAPRLRKLHADRADLVVVEVDINRAGIRGIDWKSPVAQQYGIHQVPQFKIYSPTGQLQAEGDEAYSLVMGMLR